MVKPTFQAAIKQVLQVSGVPYITWGDAASPYYKEVPEPPPAFPYCVFDTKARDRTPTTEGAHEGHYDVDVRVVGLQAQIEQVLAPYAAGSLVRYLDSFESNWSALSGDNFACCGWWRVSEWELEFESNRGPSGERVWIGTATFDALLVQQ